MKIFYLLLLVVFSSCVNTGETNNQSNKKTDEEKKTQPISKNYDDSIGYTHQGCLAIKNNNLKNGDEITVLNPGGDQTVFKSKIIGKISANRNCIILLEERAEANKKSGVCFYQLDLDKKLSESPMFVIVGNPISVKKEGNFDLADSNGDGIFEYYSVCNTSEGIVFSVWSGLPGKSTALWSGYYYLGYDMESDCPDIR